MSGESVYLLRRTVALNEERLSDSRKRLGAALAAAQKAGATIAQLMEWTGYSRRQVFNMLEAARSK